MVIKDKAKYNEYHAQWYKENRTRLAPKYKLARQQTKRRNLRFLDRVKSRGCQICGYRRCPQAIDFHHVRDKSFDISKGASQMRYPIKKLKEEIRKCVRVCSNCHREIHNDIIEL